jgi:hypothetical protein
MSWSGFPHGGVDYANYAGDFNPRVWANRGIDFAVVKIDGGGLERSPNTHPWAAKHVPQLVDAGVPYVGGFCVTRPGKIRDQVLYALGRVNALFGGLEGTIVQQDVEKWQDAYGTPSYAEAVQWAELWHHESGGHPLALYYPRWVLGASGHNLKSDWPPGTALWASDYSANHVQEKLRPYGGFSRIDILQYAGSITIAGIHPVDANLINATTKTAAYALLDRLSGKGKADDDMDDSTVVERPANVDYDEGNPNTWPESPAVAAPTLGYLLHSINNTVRKTDRRTGAQTQTLVDIKELLTEIRDKTGQVQMTPESLQGLADGLGEALAPVLAGAGGGDLQGLVEAINGALTQWAQQQQ